MRYHRYKHKSGGYYRGRGRGGRYYTKSGCMVQVIIIFLLFSGIFIFLLK